MEWLAAQMQWLATESAGLHLWGGYSRMLGLVYAIALLALVPQLVPLAGKRGMSPVSLTFDAAWRMYGLSALWWFPSVFWLSTHDLMLVLVPAVGGLAGLAVFLFGGPWSSVLLLISWVCMLSIDTGPSGLIYPWDSLLLEVGFLAPMLPQSLGTNWADVLHNGDSLGSLGIQATVLPSALLGFAHRWLLFRLVFGFGKLKFLGSGWEDRYYIKSFILTQPMPSPIGYWAYKLLPDVAWIGFLIGMFVVEMIAPWFLLTSWPTSRVLAALSIQGLMVGIQAGGNFGYFNILTTTLALPCLYVGPGSSLSWTLVDAFPLASPGQTLTQLCAAYPSQAAFLLFAVLVTIPGGCIQMIMNSWVNLSWFYWSNIRRVKSDNLFVNTFIIAPARAYTAFLRCIGQFRVIQAYGVFPPSMGPAHRWSCVYEASADGKEWHRLEYARQQSSVYTPPCFVAPYHPRIDHAVFYESLCMNGQNFTAFLANAHPLTAAPASTNWQRLQVRLAEACPGSCSGSALQGDIDPQGWIAMALQLFGLGHVASQHPVLWFFRRSASVPSPLPVRSQYIRMVTCHFLPVAGSPRVDPKTGQTQYWTEQMMDMHLEPYKADAISSEAVIKQGIPLGPYDMWPENMLWLWRAAHHSWPLAGQATLQLTAKELAALQQFRSALLYGLENTGGANGGAARPAPAASKPAAASVTKQRRGSLSSTTKMSQTNSRSTVSSSLERLTCAESTVQTFINLTPEECPREMAVTPAPLGDLTWARLPALYNAVHAAVGDHGMATAREALGKLTTPLLLALDVLFGNLPTTAEQRKAAVLAHQGRMDAAGQKFIDEYLVVLEGAPVDSALRIGEVKGLPVSTPDGRPIHYFAGNDDAGLPGSMRNPLRWYFFLHAVYVQQGVDGLVRRLELLQRAVTSLHDPAFPSALQKANKFALWQAVVEPPSEQFVGMHPVHPGIVSTEGGSSVMFLFHAAVARAWAEGNARLLAQSVPSLGRQSAAALPHFLPGTIDMIARVAAHPTLASLGRPAHRPLPTQTAWSFNRDSGLWTYEKEHGN